MMEVNGALRRCDLREVASRRRDGDVLLGTANFLGFPLGSLRPPKLDAHFALYNRNRPTSSMNVRNRGPSGGLCAILMAAWSCQDCLLSSGSIALFEHLRTVRKTHMRLCEYL